jgi:hypothetical protein
MMNQSTVRLLGVALVSVVLRADVAGDPPSNTLAVQQEKNGDAVFVTGSLIPRRVKKKRIGTTTESPIRVVDRTEIDQTAPATTVQAIRGNDPSVRVIGR